MSKANIVEKLVGQIKVIQDNADKKEDGWVKNLTDRCNTIARTERKRLNIVVNNKTGELLEEPKCSYRYYCQLMENYRNAIKALGYKHHLIDTHVQAFIRKYSSDVDGLEEMLEISLPLETLRNNLILLRSKSKTGSAYKSDLLSLKIEHHAFYMFEPKGAVKDWIRDDNSKRLSNKLHSQILVNPEWIIETATRLLTTEKPTVSDLCIGIALSTGRRLTEIMKTAKFKVVDDTTLLFSGQLKTKNRHLFEDIKPYNIPCMIKTEVVVKALKLLRKESGNDKLIYRDVLGAKTESIVSKGGVKDYDHNRAIQGKYQGTINGAMRSLMKNGNFSLKDCRAIYTEVTYEKHAVPGEARSAYRHRVLGHSLLETQLHYEMFKLDSSIKTIEFIDKKEEKSSDKDLINKKALIEYLESKDDVVKSYLRAPKVAIMHIWLKSEVAGGLELEQITPSYIRRHCLIDGKQLNLNTIKKYFHEFIALDQYQPPKEEVEKPKNKKERDLLELQERIEEIEARTEAIADEKIDLENEELEIEVRTDEIVNEKTELDDESELIEDELDDAIALAEKLEAEIEQDEIKKENAKKEKVPKPKVSAEEKAKKIEWPSADEIIINCKKEGKRWHVYAKVCGRYFEMFIQETKPKAIINFKMYYLSEIKLNETKKD